MASFCFNLEGLALWAQGLPLLTRLFSLKICQAKKIQKPHGQLLLNGAKKRALRYCHSDLLTFVAGACSLLRGLQLGCLLQAHVLEYLTGCW